MPGTQAGPHVVRLFVAIAIPEEHRYQLKRLCLGVREARWVQEDNFHLTLRFIGEIEEPHLPEIVAALRHVDSEPFSLSLSGVGHFKRGQQIRSLWAGCHPCVSLNILQNRIDVGLRQAGLSPDGRRFTPHITLGRLKKGSPQSVRDWVEENYLFSCSEFMVEQFVLLDSYLSHTGAIYSTIEEFSLTRLKGAQ